MKLHDLIFLILLVLLFGCQKDKTILEIDEPQKMRPLTFQETQLVEADHSFSFKLMNEIIVQDTSKNIFISPLSVSYAFGMALNGANGSTYEAIRNVLELQGLSEDEINQAFLSLMELLINLDEQVIFEIANSIWYKNGFPVLDSYLDVNQQYFNAEISSLDFSDPESVNIINNWVADKTHDKIKKILDSIPPDAVMYLINAIYFKAAWFYEFDKDLTAEESFYIDRENQQECYMMKTTAELDFYTDENLQAVTLPYGKGQYNMTVMLPAQDQDINQFAATFTYLDWSTLLSNMSYGKGTVELPKFKSEYKLLMNDVLKAMGMSIAFSDQADFTRIVRHGGIYISRVLHKTFVQVDEEGTEAAAVTLIEFRETSAGGDSDLDFYIKINRPFYFIIHEKESGTILFIGKIKNPQWPE